jgi:hypothetical protein
MKTLGIGLDWGVKLRGQGVGGSGRARPFGGYKSRVQVRMEEEVVCVGDCRLFQGLIRGRFWCWVWNGKLTQGGGDGEVMEGLWRV